MSFSLENPAYSSFFSHFPYLFSPLQQWCGSSIGALSASFQSPTPPLSPTAQTIIHGMVSSILGHDIATTLIRSLQHSSRVIATHHLGIDCLPELVQGVHFLEIQKLLQPSDTTTTVPIFACSGLPLQSFTYPRGLMPSVKKASGKPIRYPLFPSAMQNSLVYTCPSLQKNDILHMMQTWDSSLVSTPIWQSIQYVVHDILLQKDCLSLATFSNQIMYANAKIFKAIYPENPNTHIIYLNLEELTRDLLIHDLQNKDSILYTILFNKEVRTKVLDSLINQRGCWTEKAVRGDTLYRSSSEGTIFFWGIDAKERRVPLVLRSTMDLGPCLCYNDMTIPFTAESIIQALYEKRIYCSLFTSFITLHLEHHIQCCGGIYMVRYLPTMLETVKKILEEFLDSTSIRTDSATMHKATQDNTLIKNMPCSTSSIHASIHKKLLAYSPFTSLATGLISVQYLDAQTHELMPAGSLELIAQGGISRAQLAAIAEYSCDDLLPLMLNEWSAAHLPAP